MALPKRSPELTVPRRDAPKDKAVLPDNKGQLQPQGWTRPNSTGSGGAPAVSPQGGTPADMQPAPGGASKTIVDPSPPGR
jgi:hypothetical protein